MSNIFHYVCCMIYFVAAKLWNRDFNAYTAKLSYTDFTPNNTEGNGNCLNIFTLIVLRVYLQLPYI